MTQVREARLLQASATLYAKTHIVSDAVRVALELEEEIQIRLKESKETQDGCRERT